ncbi:MAG: DMT family transporter [Chlamydiia bacterium]|nr:DMT family transporter [Chlamydiia bacterium]
MIQHLERPQKNFPLAIMLILLADVMLAAQAVFVKLSSTYLSTNFICFARSFVNLVMLIFWVVFAPSAPKFSQLFQSDYKKKHFLRSGAGVAALYCFYYGINEMSLSSGTLLYYTFPIFVPLVSRLWLRVQIIPRMWWGIGVAFMGILFIFRPGSGLFDPVAFIPLLGAVFGAIAVVSMRTLHFSDPWEKIMAYYFTASVVVTALVLLFTADFTQEIFNVKSVLFVTLAGVFAALFQVFLTLASKWAPVRFLSPFIYISFIFGAVAEVMIWKRVIHPGVIVGFLLIVVGTILMVFLYPKEDLTFKEKK